MKGRTWRSRKQKREEEKGKEKKGMRTSCYRSSVAGDWKYKRKVPNKRRYEATVEATISYKMVLS